VYRVGRVIAVVVGLSVPAALVWAPIASGEVRVQAEATYHEGFDGSISGVRLQIYRDGYKVLSRPPAHPCPGCELRPVTEGFPNPPARVIQLDETPEPEVVFSLYTGGAHCCIFAEVFRWDEELGRYFATTHDFLDSGYRLKDLRHDGRPLFAGSDNRLAYRFTCYLCSIFPPQIWEFRDGKFIDMTRMFPRQVKHDLARVNRYYGKARGKYDIRGILPALVADKCLLGRCASGFALVRRAVGAGFVGKFEPRYEFGPHGAKYIRVLRRFLGRLGYL
jgi:hypothetical protein